MSKPFASSSDHVQQKPELVELAKGVFGFISHFDPNTGVVLGDKEGIAVDCRATPALAREMLEAVSEVSDVPLTRIFLTHYHAVRVLGREAFSQAHTVICSQGTRELIASRGEWDFESEVRRFPRLFQSVEEVPGLTWPDLTFAREMTLWLGERELRLMHPGRGHTRGDSVLWLPKERVMFAGDLVEDSCALYCGDAYLSDWRDTLTHISACAPQVIVPGRGAVIVGEAQVQRAILQTRGFLDDLLESCRNAMANSLELKAIFDQVYAFMTPKYGDWPIYEHCIPFNVSRAVDELSGVAEPSVWTAERDAALWKALQE